MPRKAKGLSAAKVRKARPGRYGDGGGLYLLVRSPEAKFWIFRYVRGRKMRELGLGPASGRTAVSLSDARKKARVLYDVHRDGRDPLAERAAGRAFQAAETAKAVTFADAAERYIEATAPDGAALNIISNGKIPLGLMLSQSSVRCRCKRSTPRSS